MADDLKARYSERHGRLAELAKLIEGDLQIAFEGIEHIDRIYARAKGIEKFVEKAGRRNDGGQIKYSNPLIDIQDQVAARVIVFYVSDVAVAEGRIMGYYNSVERKVKSPSFMNQFGYEGVHFISLFPPPIRPLADEIDLKHFEIQICTLFQHAWSEASHDVAYKPEAELSDQEKRAIAYTAAQSWGADQIFQQVNAGTFV